MKNDQNLDVRYDFFSGTRVEDIIVLSFKENLLHRTTDLDEMALLLDYLDLVSKSDAIKVLLTIGSPKKIGREEYIRFYRQRFQPGFRQRDFERLYNAINQFVLKMVHFILLLWWVGGHRPSQSLMG